MCVRVCRPPIITIVWEGCFGVLKVLSARKCSRLIWRGWIITGARQESRGHSKNESWICFPSFYPWLSVAFEGSFVAYLFTPQSHLWITVLAISGFAGLIQIPLFVNTATFPKLI